MALVANRNTVLVGRQFRRGDVVPPDLLDSAKVDQLISQRILTDTDAVKIRAYRVMRVCDLAGARRKRGDVVRAADLKLDPAKVSQLLEHRVIEPVLRAPSNGR